MARDIDLDDMSNDDLIYLSQRASLIKELELQGYDDIRERIDAAVNGGSADSAPEGDEEEDDEEEDDDEVDYNTGTVKELREELKSRELSTDGDKAELVARLEEDDRNNS